jgi:hypothetical protein
MLSKLSGTYSSRSSTSTLAQSYPKSTLRPTICSLCLSSTEMACIYPVACNLCFVWISATSNTHANLVSQSQLVLAYQRHLTSQALLDRFSSIAPWGWASWIRASRLKCYRALSAYHTLISPPLPQLSPLILHVVATLSLSVHDSWCELLLDLQKVSKLRFCSIPHYLYPLSWLSLFTSLRNP